MTVVHFTVTQTVPTVLQEDGGKGKNAMEDGLQPAKMPTLQDEQPLTETRTDPMALFRMVVGSMEEMMFLRGELGAMSMDVQKATIEAQKEAQINSLEERRSELIKQAELSPWDRLIQGLVVLCSIAMVVFSGGSGAVAAMTILVMVLPRAMEELMKVIPVSEDVKNGIMIAMQLVCIAMVVVQIGMCVKKFASKGIKSITKKTKDIDIEMNSKGKGGSANNASNNASNNPTNKASNKSAPNDLQKGDNNLKSASEVFDTEGSRDSQVKAYNKFMDDSGSSVKKGFRDFAKSSTAANLAIATGILSSLMQLISLGMNMRMTHENMETEIAQQILNMISAQAETIIELTNRSLDSQVEAMKSLESAHRSLRELAHERTAAKV